VLRKEPQLDDEATSSMSFKLATLASRLPSLSGEFELLILTKQLTIVVPSIAMSLA
jgi:hypothetical protein